MAELRRAVAFLFRRAGAPAMAERDFLMAASMDLRWFNYSAAERFLSLAATEGLVVRDGGQVRASFDPAAVDVPVSYTPPPDLLAAVPAADEAVFPELLSAIQATGGLDARAAVARVNEKQARQDVTLEVAALIVLAELGGDARGRASRVLRGLHGPSQLPGPGR